MPHIASQICRRNAPPPKPVLRRAYECHDFDRPEMYQRRNTSNSEHQMPTLSLLVSMADSKQYNLGSIRHIQDPTSPSMVTPVTAVGSVFDPSSPCTPTPNTAFDSVFELPSAFPAESPSSSVGSPSSFHYSPKSSIGSSKSSKASSFVVELEDTSPLVLAKRPVSVSAVKPKEAELNYIDQLKKPEFSQRAAAAIENIIAIEASNRLLLERAIAAEEATQLLKQKTQSLQHRIDYCSHIHRPQTAPDKTPRATSTPVIMSSFNKTSLQRTPQTPPILQSGPSCESRPIPHPRRRPAPLSIPSSLAPSPLFSSEDPFGISYTPQTPRRRTPQSLSSPLMSPTPSSAASPFATIAFPTAPRRRPSPIRISHSQSNLSSFSSQSEHERRNRAMYAQGVREKPLPPMGPTGPSAVPGKVEIGMYEGEREEEAGGKRKGLRGFLRWGKRSQTF